MKLSEFVDPGLVVTGVRDGEVDQVLAQLVEPLVGAGILEAPERVLEALLARERVLSTGIGQGTAVPHAISEVVDAPRLIVGLSPEGVDFRAMDGAPVHVFFVLLSPPDGASHHIKLLARIARLARHPEFVETLRGCSSGAEVVAHIAAYEQDHF